MASKTQGSARSSASPEGKVEEQAFWLEFLRRLLAHGLHGVQLVISDAHEGLKAAIDKVFSGASGPRCQAHCLRNLVAHVPQRDKAMVAAAVRTIFAQPHRQAAGHQLQEVVQALQARWPGAARVLVEAGEDVLAYMAFPREHWTRIFSAKVLERLNREVKRRTEVVGVFPDVASVIRLVGAVLLEIDDEWETLAALFQPGVHDKLKEPLVDQVTASSPLRLALVR